MKADAGAVRKALPTEAAHERPLAGVDASVDFQSPRLSKALSTLTAAVRFLPRVNSLMRSYPSQVRETPPAIRTGVRPLSGVNAAVNLKCPGLAEALAAVGADVRSGASVHVEVDAQIAV